MVNEEKRPPTSKFEWRALLDKIHVYGGLFIVAYLIMLGLSSLQYQHHFDIPEREPYKTWTQNIDMPELEGKQEYKLAVRDSLDLFGYTPWWKDYRDDAGVHHFMITRPGKQYWVEVPAEGNVFKIDEIRSSFISVVFALHGLTGGALEGPWFISLWKFVAQIMNVVFLAVLIITVYFWYDRSFYTYKGWIFAGTFAFVSLLTLVFIWLVG